MQAHMQTTMQQTHTHRAMLCALKHRSYSLIESNLTIVKRRWESLDALHQKVSHHNSPNLLIGWQQWRYQAIQHGIAEVANFNFNFIYLFIFF